MMSNLIKKIKSEPKGTKTIGNWESIEENTLPEMTEEHKKESIKILEECIELQMKKSKDYQNPNSRIKQADYYPRGCATILDIIYAKVLRMYSVLEAMENDPNYNPNFESLEDSGKDLINYASFMVAYMRHGIDGQTPDRDFLNKQI